MLTQKTYNFYRENFEQKVKQQKISMCEFAEWFGSDGRGFYQRKFLESCGIHY